MWRNIKDTIFFKNTGEEYSWFNEAKKWLLENWYSYWSMQRNSDIWIMKWDVIVSKWRNLSQEDIITLDWVMDCDYEKWYRNGNVRVVLYKESTPREIEEAKKNDIKINAQNIPIENPVWEVVSNEYNRHIIILLECEWKLGNYIGQWNDRVVFENKEDDKLVIKIPKSPEWLTKNEEEYAIYMREREYEMTIWQNTKNPIAPCFMIWDCLYMEKLEVCEWTDFWLDKNWKLKRFDSF